MKKLFYYYCEDAEVKANELAKEVNGEVKHSSYDNFYDAEGMDEKAEKILTNVSGETSAFFVYDENNDTAAVVMYWTDKLNNCKMTIDEFCDYLNGKEDYPLDADDIIDYNGWERTENDADVCFDRKAEKIITMDENSGEWEIKSYNAD